MEFGIYVYLVETFAIVGTVLIKSSVGFFLLRLIFERWQRISVLCTLAVFAAICTGKFTRAI